VRDRIWLLLFGLMVFASVGGRAMAQELVVQPALPGATSLFPEGDVVVDLDEEGIPANSVRMQAFLVSSAGVVDVSSVVTWAISSTGSTAYDSGTRVLTLNSPGSVFVTAVFGGLEAQMVLHHRGTLGHLSGDSPPLRPGDLRADAVPRSILNSRAVEFVHDLEQLGLAMVNVRVNSTGVIVTDDRDTFHKAFLSVRVTSSSIRGIYIPEGRRLVFSVVPPAISVQASGDMIVLSPEIADALADPQHALVRERSLSPEAQVLLEELIHAAIAEAGALDDVGENAEEELAKAITDVVVPAIISLSRLLDRAFDQWDQNDVDQLRTDLHRIKNVLGPTGFPEIIETLRERFGDEAVDAFLEALGWEDADKDGLPDWFEDWLRDQGIDPDDLPETPADLPGVEPPEDDPPPGGGGGPGWEFEEPCPSDQELPGEGEPEDPCLAGGVASGG
jgi:hypothetical protein